MASRTDLMPKIDWNNDLVGALIDSVHEHEVVWNTSKASYKNKNVQEAAWQRIAESIGLAGRPNFVKIKWRDLRDTYRKKLKSETPKSGDAGGTKKNRWPWMKAMEFTKNFFNLDVPTTSNFQNVDDSDRPRRAQQEGDLDEEYGPEDEAVESVTDPSALDFQSQGYPDLERDVDDFLEESQLADEVAFSPSLGSKRSSSSNSQRITEKPQTPTSAEPIKPNFSGKRKRKEAAAANEIDMAILTELKNSSKEETDEDSLFMKSLVPQLKRLDPKSRSFVKCQIQQLLFQAEFGIDEK